MAPSCWAFYRVSCNNFHTDDIIDRCETRRRKLYKEYSLNRRISEIFNYNNCLLFFNLLLES